MSDLHCDVAVVGGGIVGAATALSLERAGFTVCLVESGTAPAAFDPTRYDARVYAIAAGSACFLDSLGLWTAVLDQRAQAIARMQVWARAPEAALRFDAAESGAAALGWIVEHGLLARTLWSALQGTQVLSGCRVASADFGDDAVHLRLDDDRSVRARLAIGAEGAGSPLRSAAGIGTAGWGYASTALVCHLDSSTPHAGVALQRFLPTGPVALLPLAQGHRRSLVWSTTDADAQALRALDDTAFARLLENEMQGAAGILTAVTPRLAFPLRLMHAERYVAPRFALVGDSAHVIHPLAGQGLNLGLADAEALVAELAGARDARRDWTSQRTLARYERARLDANLEMMALTDTLHRGFRTDSAALRELLARGLEWVGKIPPLKRGLAQRARG